MSKWMQVWLAATMLLAGIMYLLSDEKIGLEFALTAIPSAVTFMLGLSIAWILNICRNSFKH
jgi:hypothetical protein